MNEPEVPQEQYQPEHPPYENVSGDVHPLIIEPVTFIERHGISPVLFGLLVLIGIFILYQGLGSLITLAIFGLDLKKANVTGIRIVTGLGQIAFILIPILYLVKLATFSPKEYLRIKAPKPLSIVFAVTGIFSLQQILQVYMFFQEKIPLPKFINDLKELFEKETEELYKMLMGAHSTSELLFVIFIIAFIPAIAEELMFRGLVQRSFEKSLNPVLGFILTGIIFGAYHLNPFTFIPLAGLGVYLGFLAMRSGSIWVSSTAHFFNNALACLAIYYQIDEDATVSGDPNAMTNAQVLALFAIMLFVFTVSTFLFWQVTKPRIEETIPIPTELQ